MELKTIGKIFYAESNYNERDIVKAAGFWWHGGACRPNCMACKAGLGRVWWTPYQENAIRLRQYADPVAEGIFKAMDNAVEMSKATDAAVSIPAPAGLDYMPFQRAGIAYATARQSTLIGDEMGLGKTIQALGFINANKYIQQVVCIVPASLRLNWYNEARKWLVRKFDYYIVRDNGRVPDYANFVIVNYDMLKGAVLQSLEARQWQLMIVDECHKLKNPKAQRTVKILGGTIGKGPDAKEHEGLLRKCDRRLFLTGTPILNRPVELWPIVHAVDPGTFGSFWGYVSRYCGATRSRFGYDMGGATNLGELQNKLRASCMIRRLKKDVLTELPAKRRQIVTLEAAGNEYVIQAERAAMAAQREHMEALQADVELAKVADNEDEYKEAVKRLSSGMGVAFAEMARVRHETALAKVPYVIEHVDELFDAEADKIILFAHHHDVIAKFKAHFGDAAVVLTGQTNIEERDAAVRRFQTDPSCKLFIGSITAAGVGLTLTAAAHVIFAELDWVPANMTQAEDRAHRIGQTEQVFVQHLVFDESIDAEMAVKLIAKQEIIDKALDKKVKYDLPVMPIKHEPYQVPECPFDYAFAPEMKQKIHRAIQIVAGQCDGAIAHDGRGFSGVDARIGHSLAGARELSNKQAWLAKKIVRKYKGQLVNYGQEQLLHDIYGGEV